MTPETGYAPHAHRVAESILWKCHIIKNDLQVQYSSHPKITMIFFPEIGESNPVFHVEAWECLKSQAALSKKKNDNRNYDTQYIHRSGKNSLALPQKQKCQLDQRAQK